MAAVLWRSCLGEEEVGKRKSEVGEGGEEEDRSGGGSGGDGGGGGWGPVGKRSEWVMLMVSGSSLAPYRFFAQFMATLRASRLLCVLVREVMRLV